MSPRSFLRDLATRLASGEKVICEAAKGVLKGECDMDPGMRGYLVDVRVLQDDVVKLDLNVAEFDAHNRPLGSANYYDKSGVPCLTWFESSSYPKNGVAECYVMLDEFEEGYKDPSFVVLPSPAAVLYPEYVEAKPGVTYTAWLELQVRSLRAAAAAPAATDTPAASRRMR